VPAEPVAVSAVQRVDGAVADLHVSADRPGQPLAQQRADEGARLLRSHDEQEREQASGEHTECLSPTASGRLH